jgi:hypothetical protein
MGLWKRGVSPCAVHAAGAPIVQTLLFVMRVAPDLLGFPYWIALLTEYS